MPSTGTAELAARLEATRDRVWERLSASGALREGVDRDKGPALSIPASYARMIARAAAWLDEEGDPERAEQLRETYTCWLPTSRIEQLAARDEDAAWAFDTPLEWDRLPRLSGVVARWLALLEGAGSEVGLLGARDLATFQRRYRSLGAIFERTYFGGFLPMLYAWPHDLAAYRAEALAEGDAQAVLDRRFAAPLAHELSHLHPGRAPIEPPVLDECVAGWLGCVVHPETLVPEPGEDNALYMAARFAQIGAALERLVGRERLVAAHSGVTPWLQVLPGGLGPAAARVGWAQWRADRGLHLLPDVDRPLVWIKLMYLAAAGDARVAEIGYQALVELPWAEVPAGPLEAEDVALVARGIGALGVESRLEAGCYRVSRSPAAPWIAVDAVAGVLERAPAGVWFLPPPVAAALRAKGRARLKLRAAHGAPAERAAEALAAGEFGRGEGWEVCPA